MPDMTEMSEKSEKSDLKDVTDPAADSESKSKTETGIPEITEIPETAGTTEGVEILTGDPKIALIKLSIPLIAAMMLMSVYNLIDAVWVAGLGSDALAAVGFTVPLIIMVLGLGTGIGAGVNSLLSRLIGAGERVRADNAAMHSFILTAAVAVLITVPGLIFLKPILLALGAGSTIDLAFTYAQILFTGTVMFLFTEIGYAVFRSEGNMKRPMYAMAASAVLNIILDPIFIYVLDWKIAGAAWASIISVATVSCVMLYWFCVRKDSYFRFSWNCYRFEGKIIKDMLVVGIPASLEYFLIAIAVIVINLLLVDVASEDAVAVYTSAWTVVMVALVPLVSIATAAISVYGANFGAGRYDNLRITLLYGVGMGIVISAVIGAFTYVFAPNIAYLFTYTEGGAHLIGDFVFFMQIMCLYYPFSALGLMANSLFQGIGKGGTSLCISICREVVFVAIFAFLLGKFMGLGQYGVWWGCVLGYIIGDSVAFVWSYLYVRFKIRETLRRDEVGAAV